MAAIDVHGCVFPRTRVKRILDAGVTQKYRMAWRGEARMADCWGRVNGIQARNLRGSPQDEPTSRTALRASFTISSSIASPASTSCSSVTRWLASLRQRRRVRAAAHGRMRRARTGVRHVASIARHSGNCRDSCRHRARPVHRCRCRAPRAEAWRCAGRTSWPQCRRRSIPCVFWHDRRLAIMW